MKHLRSLKPTYRTILPLIFAIVAGLSLATAAQADALTSDQIQSYIDAGYDLKGLDDDYPGLDEAMDEERDMTRPMSSVVGVLDEFPAFRSDLNAVIRNHGFDSIEDYAEVADRIILAQLAISMEDMSAENRAMIETMMNSENDQDLPAHMRDRAMEMREQTKAMMAAMETVPDEDIEAVRPFMGQLDPEEY